MDLLLDTHVLVWMGAGDPRLGSTAIDAITDIDNAIHVSAVTAFEFADLHLRGRLGQIPDLGALLKRLEAEILPMPADLWRLTTRLPDLHRDPVDRMLIAHAIHADLTLVTADETMRQYPVRSLW